MEMSSESSMTTVPDFVIVEVVSRLPIKNLVQSKSVCKRWHNLITSSHKIIRYIRDSIDHRRKNNPFILIWLPSGVETLTLRIVDVFTGKVCSRFNLHVSYLDHPYTWIANSCHGLVCFSSNLGKQIYLCNPVTREYVNIPESPADRFLGMVGLGFVPHTNRYKIVRWFFPSKNQIDSHSHPPGCEIFDIDDGKNHASSSWRAITNHLKFIRFSYKIQPVCIDGVIYWLTLGPSRHLMLLAFDTQNEESKLISLPQGVTANAEDIYLLQLGGCVSFALNVDGARTKIWSLGGDTTNQKWVQLYDIEYLRRVMTSYPADDCAEELVSMPPSVGLSLQYYNNKSNKVRDGGKFNFLHNNHPCVFFESLFSLEEMRLLEDEL